MPNEFKIRNGLVVEGGSTIITGSLIVTGGITGSLSGSGGGGGSAFPFTGSAEITGSLGVIGPSTFSGSVGIADNLTLSTGGFIYGNTTNPYIQLNNSLGSKLGFGSDSYVDVGGPTTIVNANTSIIRFRNNRIVATQNTIIGTSNIDDTPTARLQVRGSGATSATTALLVQNSNASASLTVLDNGNIGIGNAAPTVPLEIGQNLGIKGILRLWSGNTQWAQLEGGDSTFDFNLGGAYGAILTRNGGYRLTIPANSMYSFAGSSGGGSQVGSADTSISRLSSGRIGIGTGTVGNTSGTLIANNVGVGIDNPSASLHISGASSATLFEIDSPAVNNIMFVSGSGNVGIGTGTPGARLDVNGTTFLRGVALDGIFGYSGNNIAFSNAGNTTFLGNIGIGTTSPTYRLDVSGSIRVRSGFGYTSDFSGGVLGINILNVDGSDNVVIGSTFAPKNVMLTSGIRYDFASTGLGINVTSPTARLQVRGSGATSATTAFRVENSNTSASLLVRDDGLVSVMPSNANITIDGSTSSGGRIIIQNPTSNAQIGINSYNTFLYPTELVLYARSAIKGATNVLGDLRFYNLTTGKTYMFMTETGLISVNKGTVTPNADLDVSGSVIITGSLTVITGSNVELQVLGTGVRLGNVIGDAHTVTGSFSVSGSSNFNGNVTITGSASNSLLVRGAGATSSTTSLLVQNSNASASLTVLDNGQMSQLSSAETISTWTHTNGNYVDLRLGNGTALAAGQFGFYNNGTRVLSFGSNNIILGGTNTIVASGGTMNLRGGLPTGATNLSGNTTGVIIGANQLNTGPITSGSGTLNIANIGYSSVNDTWAMSSGSATLNILTVQHRYNTTGSYSGTIRGICYDPIILSLSGSTHRAIETTSGDILFRNGSSTLFFVSGSGRVGIGTGTPVFNLDVSGSGRFTDNLTVTGSSIATSNALRVINSASIALFSVNNLGNVNILPSTTDAVINIGQGFNLYTNSGDTSNPIGGSRIFWAAFNQALGIPMNSNGGFRVGYDNRFQTNFNNSASLNVSGSSNFIGNIIVTGSVIATTGFTGSLFGTASFATQALSASWAPSTGGGPAFPFTGDAVITGSLTVVTGSNIELQVTNTGVRLGSILTDTHTVTGSFGITGSLTVSGSISNNVLSGSDSRVMVATSGGTLQATNQVIIQAYIDPNGTQASLLNSTSNWNVSGAYIGTTITDTFQGQKHYNTTYFFEAVDNNEWIRLLRV